MSLKHLAALAAVAALAAPTAATAAPGKSGDAKSGKTEQAQSKGKAKGKGKAKKGKNAVLKGVVASINADANTVVVSVQKANRWGSNLKGHDVTVNLAGVKKINGVKDENNSGSVLDELQVGDRVVVHTRVTRWEKKAAAKVEEGQEATTDAQTVDAHKFNVLEPAEQEEENEDEAQAPATTE